MNIPAPKIRKPIKTALFPPNLSATNPNKGENIPQKIIWIPIARPNSVRVHPNPSSKAWKKRPKVCLRPIEIIITTQAEIRTMRVNLLLINFSDIYFTNFRALLRSAINSFGSSKPICNRTICSSLPKR